MKFDDLGNPKTRIESSEQAIKRVEELCTQTVQARKDCNVIIPDNPKATADFQERAYARWLMLYGQAIGTLISYYQCGKLQDEAYRRLKARVQATLAVSVVGAAHGLDGLQVVKRVPDLGT